MEILFSRTIFKIILWPSILGSILLCGCQSNRAYDEVVRGTITYPFYNETSPIGKENPTERFIIRTIAGNTEYVVEIPDGGRNYDIEVPIAELKRGDDSGTTKVTNAQLSDRELSANMPKLSYATEEERAVMDKAFGVGESGGPRQGPSYLLKIQAINKLYRRGDYEAALIEINNLLAFYPTAVTLYKMKGTVLIKLGHLDLAERSWIRAAELAPADPVVKKGLARLRDKIENNRRISYSQPELHETRSEASRQAPSQEREESNAGASAHSRDSVSDNKEQSPIASPDSNSVIIKTH